MNLHLISSFNELQAKLLIEELYRNKIDTAFISPGSRSTPLTSAVAYHPKFKSLMHFDERGAAFAALGYARATGKAGVLICTSGSAGANYFPAICEASVDAVPMIVLTADRPRELHAVGANQTFDQHNLFGKQVRAFLNFEPPDAYTEFRDLLSKFSRTIQRTQQYTKGPVHINCMFREPLEIKKSKKSFAHYADELHDWLDSTKPFVHPKQKKQIKSVKTKLDIKTKTILIAGALQTEKEKKAVIQFAEKNRLPIFPDIRSGLRLSNVSKNIITYADHIVLSKQMKAWKSFQVIHIGGNLVSKRLLQFIQTSEIKSYTVIHNSLFAYNPHHKLTEKVKGPIEKILKNYSEKLKPFQHKFLSDLMQANKKVEQVFQKTITDFSEISIARTLSQHIKKNNFLCAANSLSIRCLDMYAHSSVGFLPIVSNRGLSGIDGTISTAVGYALGSKKRGTLLIGDLAFLHDINSLSLVANSKYPLVIVLLNNNGGKIFSYLPIAKDKNIYKEYFETPQNIIFEHTAKQYDLRYVAIDSTEQFITEYDKAQKSKQSTIMEIFLQNSEPLQIQKKIMKEIKKLNIL